MLISSTIFIISVHMLLKINISHEIDWNYIHFALRMIIMQNINYSRNSFRFHNIFYEIAIYLAIQIICNTIGTEIVVIKNNNINSLSEMMKRGIKPLVLGEDPAINQISNLDIKNLETTNTDEIINDYKSIDESFGFISSLPEVLGIVVEKSHFRGKLYFGKRKVKTVPLAIGLAKCTRSHIRSITNAFTYSLFEQKLISATYEDIKLKNPFFKSKKLDFRSGNEESSDPEEIRVRYEDIRSTIKLCTILYALSLIILLINISISALKILIVIVYYRILEKIPFL